MTPAFTARRRAEEFNALVEGISTGALRDADHDARDSRYADLLEVVGALRTTAPPSPRPDFVADLRSRLMAEAETALVAPSETTPLSKQGTPARTRSRERRLAAAIGGFAIVSATTSMAVAAQSALPGDTLYPLKRGIENAQVRVHSGDDDKGAALLQNAAGRLDEVGQLSRGGDGSADDITATLDDFSAQATEASDLLLDDYDESGRVASLEELRDFTADSLAVLESLDGVIPPEAHAALVEAARTVTLIDQLAVKACPACTDGPAAVAPLLEAAAASLPDQVEELTGDRPARSKPGGGQRDPGVGTPSATPPSPSAPAPTDGQTSPPPSAPSLPAGGNGGNRPPADGGGAENPLGPIIDGLGGNRNTPGGTESQGTGLDDLTTGLGNLLGGG